MDSNEQQQREMVMDALSFILFGNVLSGSLKAKVCVKCGKPALDFRDGASAKEYGVSGFCQACQDLVFPPDDSIGFAE